MTRPRAADLVATIDAIGTANPPYDAAQSDVAEFMLRVDGLPQSLRTRIPQIYSRSGIERRYSCVPDYGTTCERFGFFPRNARLAPPPTTGDRNRLYREWAPKVATCAAKDALAEAACPPSQITHLIVVSCTGFFAPGLDFHMIRVLGLRADVARTTIGFMGCYAAINGLKAADAICRSVPGARALVVCVELCTLHFAIDHTIESAVVNAIFSDGAAAVVVSSSSPDQAAGKLTIAGAHSIIDSDSLDDMTWDIGDSGFLMTLSPRVPGIVARHLPDYVDNLVSANGLSRADIDYWAIHPGGRQVLDKAAQALNLCAGDLEDSYGVLRDYGNMSSPTILFILRRMLKRREAASAVGQPGPQTAVAMAFGPGLAIEGCLLRVAE